MKKLTEREAWLFLAKEWDKGYDPASEFHKLGVCNSVTMLGRSGRISEQTWIEMDDRRADNRPAGVSGYWWPQDDKGDAKRAAFCRKMADLCKPKRKKVKRAKQRS